MPPEQKGLSSGALLASGTTKTISVPFTVVVIDSAKPPLSATIRSTITTIRSGSVIVAFPANCQALVVCGNTDFATVTANFVAVATGTYSGSRAGSAITVTMTTIAGQRGPYTWQWNGTFLSGTMPAFCTDNATGAVINESSYQFNLPKI